MLPSFLKQCPNGVQISVKLQPRASRNAIVGALGNELRISVTAPPVDAAANQALIEFLSEILNCSRGKIQILRGHASRHKTLFIAETTAELVARELA